MLIETFIAILKKNGIGFFTGVPDSQLKSLCDYVQTEFKPEDHVIAVNEGNAVALAAGYHLATRKTPCVYMQNSGIGNAINPIASLLNKKVYAIPCLFVIGWRGEPGIKDEPQHLFQGEITEPLLKDLGINYFILDPEMSDTAFEECFNDLMKTLSEGNSAAILVKKNALVAEKKIKYSNEYITRREEIIKLIVNHSEEDIIVSTTGKTSRELFEIREANGQTHEKDFLTVGSMGHSSTIAMGIALQKPDKRIWCIDGDGAALMHMGALSLIGAKSPSNLIHIVINNEAHESVGGQPTNAGCIQLKDVAEACRYHHTFSIVEPNELAGILQTIRSLDGPVFIEIRSAIGARSDLGRPTSSPRDNKILFMDNLER